MTSDDSIARPVQFSCRRKKGQDRTIFSRTEYKGVGDEILLRAMIGDKENHGHPK